MTTDIYYTLWAGFYNDTTHSNKASESKLFVFFKEKILPSAYQHGFHRRQFYKRLLVLYVDWFWNEFQ